MKHSSDDVFMAKCKGLDFSVESVNYDKNLETLKGKLAEINEERYSMNKIKKFRRPFAILVAVIALMTMSVAALAASPALRDRVVRAVRHEDGSITVSITADDIGTGSSGTVRVREENGTIVLETDHGAIDIFDVYDIADLCPTDAYRFSAERPYRGPGLEAVTSYTVDTDGVTINHFVSNGFGVIQVGEYTLFYRMTDDYGVVAGTAVVEADGSVYFEAECGSRTLILQSS